MANKQSILIISFCLASYNKKKILSKVDTYTQEREKKTRYALSTWVKEKNWICSNTLPFCRRSKNFRMLNWIDNLYWKMNWTNQRMRTTASHSQPNTKSILLPISCCVFMTCLFLWRFIDGHVNYYSYYYYIWKSWHNISPSCHHLVILFMWHQRQCERMRKRPRKTYNGIPFMKKKIIKWINWLRVWFSSRVLNWSEMSFHLYIEIRHLRAHSFKHHSYKRTYTSFRTYFIELGAYVPLSHT